MLGTLCVGGKFCVLALLLTPLPKDNIEVILEPSSHFSLLLSCLNFIRNRRKHAGAGSAISAISICMYSLYSGAVIPRLGLYPGATL